MDEIHVHKTKKSICAHFAESPCKIENLSKMVNKLKTICGGNCLFTDVHW